MKPSPDATDTIAPSAVLAGTSTAVQRLRLQISHFGPHFRIILLTGEQGTGRRCIAHKLHALSPVASRPITECSLLEFAESEFTTATCLSLRGLTDLSSSTRARAIEKLSQLSRDTRVILTCGADARSLAAAGQFRSEALGKIRLLELTVPPLRQRLDDLAAIAACTFPQQCGPSFTSEHLTLLKSHTWPGNLHEFTQTCRHFLTTGQLAIEPTLPDLSMPLQRLDLVVSEHVSRVLEHCAGNKFRAAEILGISRSTLYRML